MNDLPKSIRIIERACVIPVLESLLNSKRHSKPRASSRRIGIDIELAVELLN